jgi:hypothetical protein
MQATHQSGRKLRQTPKSREFSGVPEILVRIPHPRCSHSLNTARDHLDLSREPFDAFAY